MFQAAHLGGADQVIMAGRNGDGFSREFADLNHFPQPGRGQAENGADLSESVSRHA